jgi:Zn-finger nucleic acid-binding protein
MKCPKCSSDLEKQTYRGIEVDQCINCKGMWLDNNELDQLENEVFNIEELKGSLIYSDQLMDYKCPHCNSNLHQFEYRGNNLRLDYCENQHGYWLDAGEGERVLQIMKEREKDLERKYKAEKEWTKTLNGLRSKSSLRNIKDLFK